MATGYSGTPLAKKLAIEDGQAVALLAAPDGWAVPDLPDGVEVRTDLRRAPDTTIAFVRSQAELARLAPRLAKATRPSAALWIAWPRRAGGHVSDLTGQSLRDTFLPTGLVDVKVAALDDDWSGLRFLWRKDRR